MSIEQIIHLYDDNPDHFHFEGELRALNRLGASVQPPNVIVEIGSYRGQSTCALALHAQVPVYSIDCHVNGPDDFKADGAPLFSSEDRKIWMENVLRIGRAEVVRPIELPSLLAAQVWGDMPPIGLLFIDACHEYECVRADLELWIGYLASGGLLAMHDNNKPGVMQAIEEIASQLELVEVADVMSVYKLNDYEAILPSAESFSYPDDDSLDEPLEYGVPIDANASPKTITGATNASPKVVTKPATRKTTKKAKK